MLTDNKKQVCFQSSEGESSDMDISDNEEVSYNSQANTSVSYNSTLQNEQPYYTNHYHQMSQQATPHYSPQAYEINNYANKNMYNNQHYIQQDPYTNINNYNIPHESLVSELRHHMMAQELKQQPVEPRAESAFSTTTSHSISSSDRFSYASIAKKAPSQKDDPENDSDTESFHTAPSSPIMIEKNEEEDYISLPVEPEELVDKQNIQSKQATLFVQQQSNSVNDNDRLDKLYIEKSILETGLVTNDEQISHWNNEAKELRKMLQVLRTTVATLQSPKSSRKAEKGKSGAKEPANAITSTQQQSATIKVGIQQSNVTTNSVGNNLQSLNTYTSSRQTPETFYTKQAIKDVKDVHPQANTFIIPTQQVEPSTTNPNSVVPTLIKRKYLLHEQARCLRALTWHPIGSSTMKAKILNARDYLQHQQHSISIEQKIYISALVRVFCQRARTRALTKKNSARGFRYQPSFASIWDAASHDESLPQRYFLPTVRHYTESDLKNVDFVQVFHYIENVTDMYIGIRYDKAQANEWYNAFMSEPSEALMAKISSLRDKKISWSANDYEVIENGNSGGSELALKRLQRAKKTKKAVKSKGRKIQSNKRAALHGFSDGPSRESIYRERELDELNVRKVLKFESVGEAEPATAWPKSAISDDNGLVAAELRTKGKEGVYSRAQQQDTTVPFTSHSNTHHSSVQKTGVYNVRNSISSEGPVLNNEDLSMLSLFFSNKNNIYNSTALHAGGLAESMNSSSAAAPVSNQSAFQSHKPPLTSLGLNNKETLASLGISLDSIQSKRHYYEQSENSDKKALLCVSEASGNICRDMNCPYSHLSDFIK